MPDMPCVDRILRQAIGLSLIAALGACGGGAKEVEEPPSPEAQTAETPAADPAAPEGEPTAPKPGPISKAPFGQVNGVDVDVYTLTNANGLILKVTNYGAIITELHVPDRGGELADVVHGFDNADDYVKGSPYFGATVGRVANRIAGAKFKLDGKTYKLAMNNPDTRSALHGGVKGWDKAIWTAETSDTEAGPSIKLTYVSPDGEEGYPGSVTAITTYTLTNGNELRVDMEATTDKPTIINMAHHTYWNLGGTGAGTIEDHELTLFADRFAPGLPPTSSKTKAVTKTAYDFTEAKPIGRDLARTGGKPAGYDHHYVVKGDPHQLRPFARVKDPKSGRVMTLDADQPGVQFYTANFLDGKTTGKGATHVQYSAFCLESQKVPNSINIPAWRDEVILRPGQTYKSTLVHKFTAE